jgi:hypothetical protein
LSTHGTVAGSPNGREFDVARERIAILETAMRAIEELGRERDRRYEEGKKANKEAVDAAFASAEKAVAAALTSAKEAVFKQEQAQNQYNEAHNGLLRKIDEQHKETLPRPEAEVRFTRQDEKIEDLKKVVARVELAQSASTGRSGLSNPLLLSLAGLGGAVLLYAVEHLPTAVK